MSYPKIASEQFLTNLLRRKEFYSLRIDPDKNFREGDDEFAGKYLKTHSHQLFGKNFINPNTPYKRIHLKHDTGTGKTIAAISAAMEFIKIYKKLYNGLMAKNQLGKHNHMELDKGTPSVFVLGFGGTKAAFIRELMRHTEFGFVTVSEKEELIKRQKQAEAGLPEDIKHAKDYYTHLKKRITNKSRGGFFKFYGYDEFVNRLFLSEDIKLTELEAIAAQKLRAGDSSVTLEDLIFEQIKAHKIQVNKTLLRMFENSLLICDEIHNTYNMNMKNNRGVAIQFLLDTIPSLRFLSLSATPINNSPSEVVELVNYLVPPEKKITKREYFLNHNTLKPGKLNELGELVEGKISFIQDINIKYYPRREFIGSPIIIPKDVDKFTAGTKIPYLSFIECPMSKLHQETYNMHLKQQTESNGKNTNDNNTNNSDDIDTPDNILQLNDIADTTVDNNTDDSDDKINDENYHTIPTDGYSIYDMIFPNPDNSKIGMFRSSEVRNKLMSASQEWKDKYKIGIKKYSAINNIIYGDFMEKNTLGKYSAKYKHMIDDVIKIIKTAEGDSKKCQKIMLYHDRVKMSGVLMIQEILRANGFIDEQSEPVDNTLCCLCGKTLSLHNNKTTHVYRPARFICVHSDIDKLTMTALLAKYNSPDNANGLNYMILIGSKIIKESYDFKDIQNLFILSLPISIPTLIQVLGRCIRKDSHINLPPQYRRVMIRIYMTTVNRDYAFSDPISPEMYRYIDKLSDYMIIQQIEKEFNRRAIDAEIHRDIIMPPALKQTYFPNGPDTEPIDIIGNLYFEPAVKLPYYEPNELNLSTFTAYGYYENEIKLISVLIKRLFMMQPVWTYDDLWISLRNSPIGVEVNPKLFNEYNYIIALNNLVINNPSIITDQRDSSDLTEGMLVDRLFDYNERFIYTRGQKFKIEHVGKYYILFPVVDITTNPLNNIFTESIIFDFTRYNKSSIE